MGCSITCCWKRGRNRASGGRIAATAIRYKGSRAWAFDKRKGDFPLGSNKCNEYVYNVTIETGAKATVTPPGGKPRPPLAAEWAYPNVEIPGWDQTRRRNQEMLPRMSYNMNRGTQAIRGILA